jgi:hypothetical protein
MASTSIIPDTTLKLAVRWMRGELSNSDVQKELGIRQVSQLGYKMGIALRQAYRDGIIPPFEEKVLTARK